MPRPLLGLLYRVGLIVYYAKASFGLMIKSAIYNAKASFLPYYKVGLIVYYVKASSGFVIKLDVF